MADWRNRLEQIINKFKFQLNAKGVDNLVQLKDVFLSFDANKNGVLDKLEFNEFLSKLGVFLTTQELRSVYNHFDQNKDGNINYGELVSVLRADISNTRLAIVKRAFNHLAKGANQISFETLINNYKAEEHPRVTSREKKADTVFTDFTTHIQQYVNNNSVNEEGFINYYLDLNSVLPAEKETYFVQIVLKTWGLNADASVIPAPRLAQIETIVFEKIRQRTHGADDEGKTAKRIFKHFDLEGYGTVGPHQFKQALETIGCVFNDHELAALFNKFDGNGNGKIDFEEFARWIAHKGSGNNPNVNPVFGVTREAPHQVIDKIRQVLRARGLPGVHGLVSLFRRFNPSADAKLDRHELQWVLKENGHTLTPSEFERIFKYFDKNNEGFISISEFVAAVRGELSAQRDAVVREVYSRIVQNDSIDVQELVAKFDVKQSVSFRTGTKKADEVRAELVPLFDQDNDGKVDLGEFLGFYLNASNVFLQDAQFDQFVRASWGLY